MEQQRVGLETMIRKRNKKKLEQVVPARLAVVQPRKLEGPLKP